MPRIGVITVPLDPKNISDYQFALDESTWGSPKDRAPQDPTAPRKGDVLLIASGYHRPGSRSPRVPLAEYVKDAEFEKVTLVRVAGTPHTSSAPHWPNEVAENKVHYPYRFAIAPVGIIEDVSLLQFPVQLTEAFHKSINGQSRAIVHDISDTEADDIADLAGRPSWRDLTRSLPRNAIDVVLGTNPKGTHVTVKKPRTGSGQGYQQDQETKDATEEFAVRKAIEFYEENGWDVTELGKPYDLLCVRDGQERRVEVKGTTGAAGTVNLTSNEVANAREHTTDLFIVHSIKVEPKNQKTPGASKLEGVSGTRLILPDWVPADDDLAATKYSYAVPRDLLQDPEALNQLPR